LYFLFESSTELQTHDCMKFLAFNHYHNTNISISYRNLMMVSSERELLWYQLELSTMNQFD